MAQRSFSALEHFSKGAAGRRGSCWSAAAAAAAAAVEPLLVLLLGSGFNCRGSDFLELCREFGEMREGKRERAARAAAWNDARQRMNERTSSVRELKALNLTLDAADVLYGHCGVSLSLSLPASNGEGPTAIGLPQSAASLPSLSSLPFFPFPIPTFTALQSHLNDFSLSVGCFFLRRCSKAYK